MEETKQKILSPSVDAVKLGGVGHVLRGTFKDLFGEDGPTERADTVGSASSTSADERDKAEFDQIEQREKGRVVQFEHLEHAVVESQEAVSAFDKQKYEELRRRGLVQGYELPLVRSPPRTLRRADMSAELASGIVSPGDVVDSVEREAAVRSGNLRVGADPPDFARTAGEPHYFANTNANAARVETAIGRYTNTVGGFGPAYHATGQPGLIDVPSVSGASGHDVRRATTQLNVHSTAGSTSGLRKKANILAKDNVSKGYASGKIAPPIAPVPSGSALEQDMDAEIARSLDPEEPYAGSFVDPQEEGAGGVTRSTAMNAADRRAAEVSAAARSLPEGIAGVRGEGLRPSVVRATLLGYARRHAGAGTAGALSFEEMGAHAAVTERMLRPQGYLRVGRHDRPAGCSLLTKGGGRRGASTARVAQGEFEATAAEEHAHVRSLSPPKAAVTSPRRSKRVQPSDAPTVGVAQAIGAKTGMMGLQASMAGAVPGRLPTRGALMPAVVTRAAGGAMPSEAMAGPFTVTPADVTFRGYEAGQRMTHVLTVRNVDSVLRHVRILPPSTRVFALEMSPFPSASGPGGLTSAKGVPGMLLPTGRASSAIAPGMAVRITVTFMPPTSSPFSDSFTLVTESGQFSVPLHAILPGPELTLPLHLHVGVCMKHDVVKTTLRTMNVGSRAQFRLLPTELFDAAAQSEVDLPIDGSHGDVRLAVLDPDRDEGGDGVQGERREDGEGEAEDAGLMYPPGKVDDGPTMSSCGLRAVETWTEMYSGPFRVWPATFELTSGGEVELHVIFKPYRQGRSTRRLTLLGSDGSVFSYTITAECSSLAVGLVALQASRLPFPVLNGFELLRPIDYAERPAAVLKAAKPPREDSRSSFLVDALASALGAVVTGKSRPQEEDAAVVPQALEDSLTNGPFRLRFDDLHPGTSQSKTLTVRNDAPLPVRYTWGVEASLPDPPQLPMPDLEGQDPKKKAIRARNAERQPPHRGDAASLQDVPPPAPVPVLPFTIQPSEGVMDGYSVQTFTVTFAPPLAPQVGDGSRSRAVPGGGSLLAEHPCAWDASAALSVHDVPLDPDLVAAQEREVQERVEEERVVHLVQQARRASRPGTFTPAATPFGGTPASTRPRSATAQVGTLTVSARAMKSVADGLERGGEPRVMTGQGERKEGYDDEDDEGSEHLLLSGLRPSLSRGGFGQVDTLNVNDGAHVVESIVTRTSITVAALRLHGASRAVAVSLDPGSVVVPGPLLAGQSSSGTSRLMNNGDGDVSFFFPRHVHGSQPGFDCTVMPQFGVVPAKGSVDITAMFTGRLPGEYACDFPVQVYYGDGFAAQAEAALRQGGGVKGEWAQGRATPERYAAGVLPSSSSSTSDGMFSSASGTDMAANRMTPGFVSGAALSPTTPGSPPTAAVFAALDAVAAAHAASLGTHMGIRVRGCVRLPAVSWTVARIDLGLLGCDRSAKHVLRVANLDNAPARWVAHRVRSTDSAGADGTGTSVGRDPAPSDPHVPEFDLDMDGATCNVALTPSTGMLGPGEVAEVELAVEAGSSPERLRTLLRVASVPLEDDTTERAAEARARAADKARAHGDSVADVEALLARPYSTSELPSANPSKWPSQGAALPSALVPSPSFLRLVAEVQAPVVSLSTHAWRQGTIFVGLPVHNSVTVTNLCNLPVEYSVDPYVGGKPPLEAGAPGWAAVDAAALDKRRLTRSDGKRRMMPSLFEVIFKDGRGGKGTLAPRESRTLEATLIGRHTGVVEGAWMAVDVIGLPHPLGLQVHANILGVTVAYALVNDATGLLIPSPSRFSSVVALPANPALNVNASISAFSTLSIAGSTSMSGSHEVGSTVSVHSKGSTGSGAPGGGDIAVELDENLLSDPAVCAVLEARARARAFGASTGGAMSSLAFGTREAPQPTHERCSYTLHILNLSGIPTAYSAGVDSYPAGEPPALVAAQAAVRPDSTVTAWPAEERTAAGSGLNWPALYDAAERISSIDKVSAARQAAKRGLPPPPGPLKRSSSPGNRSSSPHRKGGRRGGGHGSLSPPRAPLYVPRPARYGVQAVPSARVGDALPDKFAFAVAPTSVVMPDGSLAFGGSVLAMDGVHGKPGSAASATTLSHGRRASQQSAEIGKSAGGRGSMSPPPSVKKRPRLFLSAAHESTQRFASSAGRTAREQAELERLNRAALGEARGLALQVYPQSGVLPAYGHASLQIAAVGDMSGSYEDVLRLTVDGVSPMHVPVSVVLAGSPLTLVGGGGTVGLSERGACGALGPTLSFGDQLEGGAPLSKSVTLSNSCPMDAHVVLHLGPDAMPHARVRRGAVVGMEAQGQELEDATAAGANEEHEAVPSPFQQAEVKEGEEEHMAQAQTAPGPTPVAVVLDPEAVSTALASTNLPFHLGTTLLLVPAYGRATLRITCSPRHVEGGDITLARACGWSDAYLYYLRGCITGHTVYTPAGESPPPHLLGKAAHPPPVGEVQGEDMEVMGEGLDQATLCPATIPSLQRSALVLHTSVRPFTPALTIDKKSTDGEGRPWVKFSVWSTALETGAGSGLTAARAAAQPTALHPSCVQEIVLTNGSAAEVTFFLTMDGPFRVLGTATASPPHPVTRLDLLHTGDKARKRGGREGEQDSASQGVIASLFPPGTLQEGTRILSLPPGCTITVTLAFDPEAGRSLRATAAQMFFSGTTGAGAALSSTPTSLTAEGVASLRSPPPLGTITLGGIGGMAGGRPGGGSSSDVTAVITSSLSRLKGEYAGALRATYSTGAVQEIGMRAEVLKPALLANPSALAFGTVRAGGGARVATVQLTNPTLVDASWAVRHVPSSAGPRPQVQPGASTLEVDWRSLGLDPSNPLWAAPTPGETILDDPTVFAFTQLSGSVSGPTAPPDVAAAALLRHTPGLPVPTQVEVRFAPAKAGLYQCRFRIAVRGGEAQEVVLRGRGTLEEVEHAHANSAREMAANTVGPGVAPFLAGWGGGVGAPASTGRVGLPPSGSRAPASGKGRR